VTGTGSPALARTSVSEPSPKRPRWAT
jgi:hypothetical protein